MAIFVQNYAASDQGGQDLFVPTAKSWRIMSLSANAGFPLRLEIDASETVGGRQLFSMDIGRPGDVAAVAAVGAQPILNPVGPSSTYALPDIPLPAGSSITVSMPPGSGETTVTMVIQEGANI